MKTLHVFDTVDPASGGPIASFQQWGGVLTESGLTPEVVSLDDPASGLDQGFPFKLTMLGNQHARIGATYRYSPKLLPWMRERRGDFGCVTAHNMWTYSVLGTARALRASSTPYLIFTHGMMDPWFRDTYPFKHIKKQIYWSLLLGRAMQGASRVLFTAEEERRLAKRMFFGFNRYREEVVSYGTADATPLDGRQIAAFHAACPGVTGRRFILFLSRIHPKKGCDLLIKAFAVLAGAYQDVDLVMAGPDATGWRATLQLMAAQLGVAGRIHWPGMLQGDAKNGAFRAAEVFALPSHQENFGIAVAEALAFGLPVLITRRINIWREIVGAGAGLAGEDDATDTTALLRRLLSLSRRERQNMGEAARALFLDRFEVSKTAQDMVRVIREVAR